MPLCTINSVCVIRCIGNGPWISFWPYQFVNGGSGLKINLAELQQ